GLGCERCRNHPRNRNGQKRELIEQFADLPFPFREIDPPKRYARLALERSTRNASEEIHSAPHACTVSASIESDVATISSNCLAYLLANRSMIASADCPLRE